MGRYARLRSSIVVAAVVGSFGTSAFGQEMERPAIAVLTYDFAAVPHATMQRAREKVIRIFRETGADIVWADPGADPAQQEIDRTSNSTSLFTVRMLLRARRMNGSMPTEDSVMGTAFPASDTGGTLSLFYEQVLRAALKYGQPLADILAIVIAHEMGHLLLPHPAHSLTGVMRASWGGDDIRHAVLGTLGFTASQAALIRTKVCRSADAIRSRKEWAAGSIALDRRSNSSSRRELVRLFAGSELGVSPRSRRRESHSDMSLLNPENGATSKGGATTRTDASTP
jgi:hypothetical protein